MGEGVVGWARYRAKYILMNKAFENKKMLKNKVAILIFIVAAAVRIFIFSAFLMPPSKTIRKNTIP